MINKKKVGNLTLYVKNNDKFYESIFHDFLHFRLNITKVFRSIDDTKVVLIDTERGPYVLKVFVPRDRKFERILKSFVKGDYYENLIKQTDRVREEGLNFVNDFYFLAEKKIFNFSSVFIMLIEYIEGIEVFSMGELDDQVVNGITQAVYNLHDHGMVSGDPHPGNFILTPDGIKIIDLSGKKATASLKMKDLLDLERHYGVALKGKTFTYYSFMLKKKIRMGRKKIKAKILSYIRQEQ